MEFVDKVGFELEGGWKGTRGLSPFDDISLIRDASINGQRLRGRAIAATHVGEAVSDPFPAAPAEPWEEWLRVHWPNADPPDRTNETCGFHIHVSLNKVGYYTLLSAKDFLYHLHNTMMQVGRDMGLMPDHDFWDRMNGRNTFCTLLFDSAKQMKVKKDGGIHTVRYGWLNFSWKAHGTLEFRALPTFETAEQGITAAHAFLNTIEFWLKENHQRCVVREASFRG